MYSYLYWRLDGSQLIRLNTDWETNCLFKKQWVSDLLDA